MVTLCVAACYAPVALDVAVNMACWRDNGCRAAAWHSGNKAKAATSPPHFVNSEFLFLQPDEAELE
jgi:hypothetical protein